MLATSPRERYWLAWRTLGIHLSLANLKWELPLLVQVLPGQAWRSDSSRCYLHQAVQSTSRWDRAVLGRATEFCSSQPSYCPALEAPLTPSFSPACLPACSPAPEGVLFLLCNPSGFESSNTHLVRVCAHAYMFTCVHMLVVARVQHLASSSITNNRFFLFLFFFLILKQNLFEPVAHSLGKLSWSASLRDLPVSEQELKVYTSCPAFHLGLDFDSLSHLHSPLLRNPSSILCVCHW